jgi:hypothetical protein
MSDGCRQKPGILEIPGFYVLRFFMLTYLISILIPIEKMFATHELSVGARR